MYAIFHAAWNICQNVYSAYQFSNYRESCVNSHIDLIQTTGFRLRNNHVLIGIVFIVNLEHERKIWIYVQADKMLYP